MSDGRIKVPVIGAAGRDFRNFDLFHDNHHYELRRFHGNADPLTNDRKYPAGLAGFAAVHVGNDLREIGRATQHDILVERGVGEIERLVELSV